MSILSDAIDAEIAALTPVIHVAPDALGYGTDLECRDDIARDAGDISGIALLQQDVYHWLITAPGQLPGESAEELSWGFGASQYLHAGLTQTELARIASNARNGLVQDDRIAAAEINTSFSGSTLVMKLRITPADSTETFTLIVYVAADGSTKLEIG